MPRTKIIQNQPKTRKKASKMAENAPKMGVFDSFSTQNQPLNATQQQPIVPPTDPVFQPPTDPLKAENVKSQAKVIYRDLPITTISSSLSISNARFALANHLNGNFIGSSELCDEVLGDDRVTATLNSRTNVLLGRSARIALPDKFKDDVKAQACYDSFIENVWQPLSSSGALVEMQRWAILMGFSIASINWDTSNESLWIPYVFPQHLRHVYYDWSKRKYILSTQDGQVPITGGNGSWILYAPTGEYRAWIHGVIRAITEPFIFRHYTLRDMARWSEKHGLPIFKAKVPSLSDPEQDTNFFNSLTNIGQEAILVLPQNTDAPSYDLEMLEAQASEWQGFIESINLSDKNITLAILNQNLTTEAGREGSYAAARVHADVKQAVVEADARSLSQMIYMQIARPFAQFNFGNADYAPRIFFDVSPAEDAATNASTLNTIADALTKFKALGIAENDISDLLSQFGLTSVKLTKTDINNTELSNKGSDEILSK